MQVDEGAITAHQHPLPNIETRIAKHDAELIDAKGMVSRFHRGLSLAPAQMNLQPPLLPALLNRRSRESTRCHVRFIKALEMGNLFVFVNSFKGACHTSYNNHFPL
jgi:hypothetical protein